jgi:formylglycine-generating enzyme required for sulfatase activity
MKIKSIFTVFFLFVVGLAIFSCSDDDPVITPDPPKITSLSATEFQVGDEIIINGEGFGTEIKEGFVEFGDVKPEAADYAMWTDTKIKVEVPATAQDGDLSVTNENGKSNVMAYTIFIPQSPPDISAISPEKIKSGEELEITGINFGETRGTSYVLFHSNIKPVEAEYVSWSDTKIKVTVPEDVISGKIYVYVNDTRGTGAELTIEFPIGNPVIESISPAELLAGGTITVSGQNFGASSDAYDVMVIIGDDDPAKIDPATISDWSETSLKVVISDQLAPGKIKFYLRNDILFSNKFEITILEPEKPAPVLTSATMVTPMHGEEMILIGTDFGDDQDLGYVMIGTEKAVTINTWTDTEIKVVVPADCPLTGKVYVEVNSKKSNELDYTLVEPDLKITSLNPSNLYAGEPTTIMGEGFGGTQGTSYVSINGVKVEDAAAYTFWDDEHISLTVPELATSGLLKVVVDGVESKGLQLNIIGKIYAIDMVEIPAGEFMMGKEGDDWDAYQHKVKITKPFFMAKMEISQKLWGRIKTGSNPSKNKDEAAPVEQVSWLDAVEWCNKASKYDELEECYTINGNTVTCNFEANGYRLPTEAEWEYACRAGTTTDLYGTLGDIAWYNVDNTLYAKPCGDKTANAWGLYDMVGNVSEWCWDWYDSEYYNNCPESDPKGSATEETKVVRGGAINSTAEELGAWKRDSYGMVLQQHVVGFRVVRNK